MTDHPSLATFELFTMGALEDDADFVAHVAGCEACSATLAKEARLELALKDVATRPRSIRRLARVALPFVAVAAAAAVLFAVRSHPGTTTEIAAEPSVAAVGTDEPADANAVVAALRHSFRACYAVGLARDPMMQGRVSIDAFIDVGGNVTKATAVERVGLSEEVATCLTMVVMTARFAPGDHETSLHVPISFVQAGTKKP